MTSFCCGCPLEFGVGFIIFLNLVQNLFYLTTATMNVILRVPTVGSNEGLITQTCNAAWCLLGLPFIFAAIWGMVYRQEANVRLYFNYLLLSLGLDVFFIIAYLATTDMCVGMPTALMAHGSAFACGFMRLVGLTAVLMLIVLSTYFVFTVWSYCEDLKAGGGGQGFPALIQGSGEMRIKRRQQYGGAMFGNTFGGYGNADTMGFGSYDAPGLGDFRSMFDGEFHETQYPPYKNF